MCLVKNHKGILCRDPAISIYEGKPFCVKHMLNHNISVEKLIDGIQQEIIRKNIDCFNKYIFAITSEKSIGKLRDINCWNKRTREFFTYCFYDIANIVPKIIYPINVDLQPYCDVLFGNNIGYMVDNDDESILICNIQGRWFMIHYIKSSKDFDIARENLCERSMEYTLIEIEAALKTGFRDVKKAPRRSNFIDIHFLHI